MKSSENELLLNEKYFHVVLQIIKRTDQCEFSWKMNA